MSEDPRRYLGLNIGEIVLDDDIRNKFTKHYIEKNLTTDDTGNLTINEGIFILPQDKVGRVVNIYVDDKKVITTSGVFNNGYYSIYINNNKFDTIYVNNIHLNLLYLHTMETIP